MFVIRKENGIVYAKYEVSRAAPLEGEEPVSQDLFDLLDVPCAYEKVDRKWAITKVNPPVVIGAPSTTYCPEAEPTMEEQLRADVDYIAAMTGVEL